MSQDHYFYEYTEIIILRDIEYLLPGKAKPDYT